MIRLHNAWARIEERKQKQQERAAEGKQGSGHPDASSSKVARPSDKQAFDEFRSKHELA